MMQTMMSHSTNNMELSFSGRLSPSSSLSISCVDSTDNEKIHAVRTKMSELLEERLTPNHQEQSSPNSKRVAKRLEQLLFQASPSLFAYQDKETLDDRIRSVATAVMVQRRMKSSSQQRDRTRILYKTLGKENYHKAKVLVQEIRLAKNQKVATMKCNGNACCTRGPMFRDTFPPVVKALFFETALMDAFDRSPVERIPTRNWTELLATAEENLRAYREWSS